MSQASRAAALTANGRVAHPQPRMATLLAVGRRAAPVLDQEHPQPLGGRAQVLLGIQGPQHRILRDARVEGVDEPAKGLLAPDRLVHAVRPHAPIVPIPSQAVNAARAFDVIVIGLGPGGEDLAEALAGAGRSVLGIDQRLVGGECPYYGCIPSKMMVRGAELLAEARRVDGMAGTAEVTPDFAPVAHRIRAEATDDWDDRVAVERLEGAGATFVRGTARLAGRDAEQRVLVEVDDVTYAG